MTQVEIKLEGNGILIAFSLAQLRALRRRERQALLRAMCACADQQALERDRRYQIRNSEIKTEEENQ